MMKWEITRYSLKINGTINIDKNINYNEQGINYHMFTFGKIARLLSNKYALMCPNPHSKRSASSTMCSSSCAKKVKMCHRRCLMKNSKNLVTKWRARSSTSYD